MKAFILAGGLSSNLYPFSKHWIKGMFPFGNTNLLINLVKQVEQTGINEIYIILNEEKSTLIRTDLNQHVSSNVYIRYIFQDSIHSIGETLLLCENYVEENSHFLLIYGDIFLPRNPFKQFLNTFKQSNLEALGAITHTSVSGTYDTAHLTTNMRIARIQYNDNNTTSNYILSGFFILPSSFFQLIKESNNNMQEALGIVAKQGKLASFLWNNDWIDVGYPWHFLLANQMLMNEWQEASIHKSAIIETNVNIRGAVHIGENVTICSGSTIVGPCYIGDNSFISNNCLIRHYSSIGKNSTISYGTEIKNSILCENVKIGRLSFIGDSVVGKNTETGSSIITINYSGEEKLLEFYDKNHTPQPTGLTKLGSFIGDYAKIGSGHNLPPGYSIAEGKQLPSVTTVNYLP